MTTYTVTTGSTEYAAYLEQAGTALGGLRIHDQGGGIVTMDEEALDGLRRQPGDADGFTEDTGDGPVLWLQGTPFPVVADT